MDPDQTWSDLATAIGNGKWDEAIEIAGDLLDWIEKGGFPVEITGVQDFDKLVISATCRAILSLDIVV